MQLAEHGIFFPLNGAVFEGPFRYVSRIGSNLSPVFAWKRDWQETETRNRVH